MREDEYSCPLLSLRLRQMREEIRLSTSLILLRRMREEDYCCPLLSLLLRRMREEEYSCPLLSLRLREMREEIRLSTCHPSLPSSKMNERRGILLYPSLPSS